VRSYIIETIFCDNEQDPDVLHSYFLRFRHTITSIAALKIPQESVVSALIYVSSDKASWIEKIRSILREVQPTSMVRFSLSVYEHPAEGYGYPADSHIDLLKNPNKSTDRRIELFSRHANPVLIMAEHTIRVAIDDDDLFLQHHLLEVDAIVTDQVRRQPDTILAIGLSGTFVGYSSDDEVRVECVSLSRTITGNKFFIIPYSHYSGLERYSPWQIPEVIDLTLTQRHNSNSFRYDVVHNNAPGLIYMRRQQNLSNQSKNPYVLGRTKEISYSSEADLIADLPFLAGYRPSDQFVYGPFPTPFRIWAERIGEDTVQFRTNLEEAFDAECEVAFYLLKDGDRVDNVDYGPSSGGQFEESPCGVQVRAFVRNPDKAIVARLSSPVV